MRRAPIVLAATAAGVGPAIRYRLMVPPTAAMLSTSGEVAARRSVSWPVVRSTVARSQPPSPKATV